MNLIVENIKCGGCTSSITKKLRSVLSTNNINIDIDAGIVSIDVEEGQKDRAIKVLQDMGYPQKDSVNGFNSTKAKAKSFISCAIGKINK
jgi:copper chaperone CopZ